MAIFSPLINFPPFSKYRWPFSYSLISHIPMISPIILIRNQAREMESEARESESQVVERKIEMSRG